MASSGSDAPASGGCLCGAVRFEAELPSRFCAHCHCDNCRRAHGAAFVTWVGFQASQVSLTAGAGHVKEYLTDTGATRTFCDVCGTTLFYSGPRWPDELHVARAVFDGEIDREPQAHVYVDFKADWHRIGDDLPQLGGVTPDTKK